MIFILYTGKLSISDLCLVNVHLISIALPWEQFGLALKMSPLTLQRIRSSYPQLSERCFTEMLAAWLNGEHRPQESPDPNWGEVIDVLKAPSVNRRDVSYQLLLTLKRECSVICFAEL